jgi:hypothetical protein
MTKVSGKDSKNSCYEKLEMSMVTSCVIVDYI